MKAAVELLTFRPPMYMSDVRVCDFWGGLLVKGIGGTMVPSTRVSSIYLLIC